MNLSGHLPDDIIRTSNPKVQKLAQKVKRVNQYLIAAEVIGEGVYGKVKRCKNEHTGKWHAVKIYHTCSLLRQKSFHNDTEGLADENGNEQSAPRRGMRYTTPFDKMIGEIRILQSIDYTGCVKLIEVLHVEGKFGTLYLVQELLDFGISVEEQQHPNGHKIALRLTVNNHKEIENSKPVLADQSANCPNHSEATECETNQTTFDEEFVKSIAKDIAETLIYLHQPEVRIAHRDIKPDNILIAADGRAKLGDFGVSCRMDLKNFRVTKTAGTYHFLAPECCRQNSDPTVVGQDGRKVDIWALGVTIWLMIFGELPIDGGSVMDLFINIESGFWTLPNNEEIRYSKEFEDMINKVLCGDPKDRISAEDLLQHPWIKSADRTAVTSRLKSARQLVTVEQTKITG